MKVILPHREQLSVGLYEDFVVIAEGHINDEDNHCICVHISDVPALIAELTLLTQSSANVG